MNKPVKDQQAPALVCPLPVWSGVLHASGRRMDLTRVQVASVRRVRTCGDGETLIEMADAPDLVVEETMDQVLEALGCGADGHPLQEAPAPVEAPAAPAVDPVWAAVEAERMRLAPNNQMGSWSALCGEASRMVARDLGLFVYDGRYPHEKTGPTPRRRILRAMAMLRAALDDFDTSGGTDG